jgi:hypothetical protein
MDSRDIFKQHFRQYHGMGQEYTGPWGDIPDMSKDADFIYGAVKVEGKPRRSRIPKSTSLIEDVQEETA